MTISRIEYVLWGTGILLYGALALRMYWHRLYHRAPLFTAWISEMFASAIILLPVSRMESYKPYMVLYWLLTFLELGLQLGSAAEFATLSLRDNGAWLRGAKQYLAVGFTCALLLSCGLTFLATPAASRGLDAFYVRSELLTSLLTVFATLVIFSCSERYGSLWPRNELLRFFGFIVFASASAITDCLHIWWRTESAFLDLEIFRMVVSQAVLVYWWVFSNGQRRQVSELERQSLSQIDSVYRNK